jgi:hypothetical protein
MSTPAVRRAALAAAVVLLASCQRASPPVATSTAPAGPEVLRGRPAAAPPPGPGARLPTALALGALGLLAALVGAAVALGHAPPAPPLSAALLARSIEGPRQRSR